MIREPWVCLMCSRFNCCGRCGPDVVPVERVRPLPMPPVDWDGDEDDDWRRYHGREAAETY